MQKVSDKEVFTVRNDEFFEQVVFFLEQGRRVTIPCKGYSMLPTITRE